jgi:hypothetical protein
MIHNLIGWIEFGSQPQRERSQTLPPLRIPMIAGFIGMRNPGFNGKISHCEEFEMKIPEIRFAAKVNCEEFETAGEVMPSSCQKVLTEVTTFCEF